MNISQCFSEISAQLSDATDESALEARLIIQKATGLSRPVLLSHPERELTDVQISDITGMTGRRRSGFPLPYILGEWEFYGRSFCVDPSVLIPRPETELLVEEALGWLRRHPDVRSAFDIGTGSGCIAISLLCEKPYLHMTAADLHRAALLTACRNAERHHVRERFHPVQADLFSPFSALPQLICANLPYIPSETCKTIEPARFEPLSALDGGPDGFDLYRLLFSQIKDHIPDECLILCEIEYRQQLTASKTAEQFFPGRSIRIMQDLSGLPRLLRIE